MTHPLALPFFDAIRALDVVQVRRLLQTEPRLAQEQEMGLTSPLVALYERAVSDSLTDEQARAMARDEIAMEQALLAAGAPIRGQNPRPAQALPGHWALLGAITHECFNRLEEEYSTPSEQAQRFEAWMARVPTEHQEGAITEVIHQWHQALEDRLPLNRAAELLGQQMLNIIETLGPPTRVYEGCEEQPMAGWIQTHLQVRARAEQGQRMFETQRPARGRPRT